MRQLQASRGGKPREHLPNLYFVGLCKRSLCMLIMPSLTLIAWKLRSNWTLFYPICGVFCCLKVRRRNLANLCEARLSWYKVSIMSIQERHYRMAAEWFERLGLVVITSLVIQKIVAGASLGDPVVIIGSMCALVIYA